MYIYIYIFVIFSVRIIITRHRTRNVRTRGGLRLNPVRYKLGGIASLIRLPLPLPPRPRLPPRQPCTTERPTFPSFLPIVRQFFSNKNPQLPSGRFSRKRVETDKETEREREPIVSESISDVG